MSSCEYDLKIFGGDCPAPNQDLADLHAELLPHSPVAMLGRDFMERFYYRILPKEDFTCGAVAYVDRNPAGFVVACSDSTGFMPQALRRHWLLLCWVIATSVISRPSRFKAIWEAWQIMSDLKTIEPAEQTGELLSIGVSTKYRSVDFVRRTGLNIALDLRRTALTTLRSQGVKSVRTVVDADNLFANVFYRADGWIMSRDSLKGWSKPSVEYSKQL